MTIHSPPIESRWRVNSLIGKEQNAGGNLFSRRFSGGLANGLIWPNAVGRPFEAQRLLLASNCGRMQPVTTSLKQTLEQRVSSKADLNRSGNKGSDNGTERSNAYYESPAP